MHMVLKKCEGYVKGFTVQSKTFSLRCPKIFLELFKNYCGWFLVCFPDMTCICKNVYIIFNTNDK